MPEAQVRKRVVQDEGWAGARPGLATSAILTFGVRKFFDVEFCPVPCGWLAEQSLYANNMPQWDDQKCL